MLFGEAKPKQTKPKRKRLVEEMKESGATLVGPQPNASPHVMHELQNSEQRLEWESASPTVNIYCIVTWIGP